MLMHDAALKGWNDCVVFILGAHMEDGIVLGGGWCGCGYWTAGLEILGEKPAGTRGMSFSWFGPVHLNLKVVGGRDQ